MKKLLLALPLLLSLAAVAYVVPSRSAAFRTAAAGCSTSDTTIPHDTLLYGWEAPEGTTWSTTGATVTQGATNPGSIDDGRCAASLKIEYSEAAVYATTNFTAIDLDTVSANVVFYLYVDTLDASDIIRAGCLGFSSNPAASFCVLLQMLETSGTFSLVADATVDSSAETGLAFDTWHKVLFHLDTTLENSYMQVNGGTQRGFTRVTGVDLSYIHLGATSSVGANESGTLYYDTVCLDTP